MRRDSLFHTSKLEKFYLSKPLYFEISTWKVFLNIFIGKNLTDFRKTVETGLDPPLLAVFSTQRQHAVPSVTQDSIPHDCFSILDT